MGIVIDKQVNTHCKLGVWQITEEYSDLFSRVDLDQNDYETLLAFRNQKRKLEWLSIRVLLDTLTNKKNKILYNGNRRPYLSDRSYNISISHSDRYATILICKDKHVGIDIEKMRPIIGNIATKFLKEKELKQIDHSQKIYHLYLHWCAKEALYKICDRKRMSLKNNITIEPFIPDESGIMHGNVHYKDISDRFKLNYFSINNYSVVWCRKESLNDDLQHNYS
ncbi:MAG: 4'-phosphopantetheinyl transferase superfamily protein [Bacteroidales bacterium]|nr:4'-phosphopantetheinyl transferase superfamily protein [Bacteroidales bacterium]MBS3773645.1 4'-phosphopantetheinyl transferase superfamily protein [Bacteroidales bacterium]